MWHTRHSMFSLVSFLMFVGAQTKTNNRNYATVTLSDGRQLRGEVISYRQRNGTETFINRFLGIQYGAPPTGDRRFAQPEPSPVWTGLRDALKSGPRCVQSTNPASDESEDCLYLNVYSPSLAGSNPVMVWIHGGGWLRGSGNIYQYDGTPLAAHGVVIVSFNYRLGPMGFFTSGDDVMPGNYGMLDQVMALRWVKDNIRAFGGDPESVSIFGESAGAASVSLHVLSSLSQGLFHRAIIESGSSLNLWATERPGSAEKLSHFTQQVSARVGCNYTDSTSRLMCLRAIDAQTLQSATLAVRQELRIEIPLTPRVERKFGFMPDYPARLLERGSFNRVDTLRGFNSGEYSYFIIDPENKGIPRNEFNSTFKKFFGKYPVNNRGRDFLVRFVNREYLDNRSDPFAVRESLVTTFAHIAFGLGSILELHKILESSGANSRHFVYEMYYQTSLYRHPHWMGVLHAAELPLVFMNLASQQYSTTDLDVGEKVQTLWTNFAKNGNPVSKNVLENGIQLHWDQHTLYNPTMLKIDARSTQVQFMRNSSLNAYGEFLKLLQEN